MELRQLMIESVLALLLAGFAFVMGDRMPDPAPPPTAISCERTALVELSLERDTGLGVPRQNCVQDPEAPNHGEEVPDT